MPDNSSDDEWEPPCKEKPKPKNHALLVAKAKKAANKGKIDIRCEKCGKTYTDKQQLKSHKKLHGSY
jgi:hypothetical protein